jgi:dTDP-4-amino-4,6-dideoxygalactose transaminase
MSELHAAVGLVHLSRLDESIAVRTQVADVYGRGLAGIDGVRPLPIPIPCRSNYYKYIAVLAGDLDRAEVKSRLEQECRVRLSGEVYALPLHRQPVFAGMAEGDFPVADDICARHVCLPIYSNMTVDEAAYVVGSVKATMARTTSKAGQARA